MERLALVCIFFLSIGRVVDSRTAPFNGQRQSLQSTPSPLSAPSSNVGLPAYFHTPPVHTPSSSSPSSPYFPSSAPNCTQMAGLTQGPYWIEENIEASNVRLNLTYGVPLNITFKITNGSLSNEAGYCVPIKDARIDLWHARYDGKYSDEQKEKTLGETWLRGYLLTNSTGHATFYTIFPEQYTYMLEFGPTKRMGTLLCMKIQRSCSSTTPSPRLYLQMYILTIAEVLVPAIHTTMVILYSMKAI
ncbi:hypothetical protein KP509_17G004400 [Ceratopteris richardii]|uniref:Intradiol ring-cleavage dioxygenases domain-containing protein n=1 Tax=Ceratopteris richardii TaxID=49495 RepID=A0A8T2STN7_CERRI|nr:hypothetical protein KP509_17G004400 [Ceratopteris richardii]